MLLSHDRLKFPSFAVSMSVLSVCCQFQHRHMVRLSRSRPLQTLYSGCFLCCEWTRRLLVTQPARQTLTTLDHIFVFQAMVRQRIKYINELKVAPETTHPFQSQGLLPIFFMQPFSEGRRLQCPNHNYSAISSWHFPCAPGAVRSVPGISAGHGPVPEEGRFWRGVAVPGPSPGARGRGRGRAGPGGAAAGSAARQPR